MKIMFIIRKTLKIKPSSLFRLISTATLPEPPTSAAYDELINTAGRNHDFATVSHLLNQRYEKGFFATNNTFKFISTDISILNDVLKTVSDLEKLHCRKTSYTSLISTLCKIRRVDDALTTSNAALDGDKSNADAATFHPIISLLTRGKDFDGAWRVIGLMKEKNVARDVTCYNYFLTAYSISKDLKSNIDVLKRMAEEGLKADARTYDALVIGACKIGKVDGGILILKKMLDDGVEAMYATYAHIIGSLVKLERFSDGVKFVIDQGGTDKKLDVHNFGLLATRLIGAKKVDEAKNVVEEMVKRDLELDDNLRKFYDENVKV
uniref:pentatricopeptide repeat-containing protein At2g40240, mitochondrial n=1 Tax=Erigeron canadensis TaxID=72917 RepID=UPI001CB8C09F|nr:pentatricopeptide repeat-containing protein At2g40240, mitochondrial [Erigeron canadensis]